MTDSVDEKAQRIAQEVIDEGLCILPGFLDADETRELARECRTLWDSGAFREAGVGVGAERVVRKEIRSDHVRWLDPDAATPAQRAYLDRLELLRRELNRLGYLGLWSFEGHLAVYPAGSFYKRHLDQFRGAQHRIVTCILYLNENWSAEDGGQLRIFLEHEGAPAEEAVGATAATLEVQPLGGQLVVFLSGRFPHEVLPARRERMSLTGWFRLRT